MSYFFRGLMLAGGRRAAQPEPAAPASPEPATPAPPEPATPAPPEPAAPARAARLHPSDTKSNLDERVLRDAEAAIAFHLAHRRADVPDGPGSGLWDVGDLEVCRGSLPAGADVPRVCFGPRKQVCSTSAETARALYADEEKMGPVCVLPIDNVVVAGGSAAWPFIDPEMRFECVPRDVDFFIHGLDPADPVALWSKAQEVVDAVVAWAISAHGGHVVYYCESVSRGVITLSINLRDSERVVRELKVQVILRAYRSVSAILHAFDVPSCSVAFDGAGFVTTALGAFAIVNRINLVVPQFRSTTFEHRLVKYLGRGFALGLPDLDVDKAAESIGRFGEIRLPFLRLHARSVSRNVFCLTKRNAPGTAGAHEAAYWEAAYLGESGSDYECTRLPKFYKSSFRALERRNITAIVFDPSLVVYRSYYHRTKSGAYRCRGPHLWPSAAAPPKIGDVFRKECAFSEIVASDKRALLCAFIPGGDAYSQDRPLQNGCADSVRRFLAEVPPKNLSEISRLLSRTVRSARYERDTLFDKIFREFIAGRAEEPLQFFYTVDPGRQDFTAAFNPVLCDPAVWYGDLFRAGEPAAAKVAAESKVYDLGECPICLSPIGKGTRNVVVLGCGHMVHMFPSSVCGGFEGVEAKRCPICRASVTAAHEASFYIRTRAFRAW